MKLLIYRNEKEFSDFLKQGNTVSPFVFKETGDSIADNPQITVDVTATIWHIERERQNIQPFICNFKDATTATIAIASESVLPIVKQYLYTLFDEIEYIFNDYKYKSSQKNEVKQLTRRTAYYYSNAEHFEKLHRHAQDNDLLYIGFSQTETLSKKLNDSLYKNFEFFLDIDSLLYVIENNKAIIYLLEGFLQSFPNATILFHQENADKAKRYFPLFLERIVSIDEKIPECALEQGAKEQLEKKPYLIANLTEDKLASMLEAFNERLAGHHHFKKIFARAVRNFVLLNKIGKRKVLSIFLFGDSGVGKTETARIIQELLCKDTSLAKINFGNYSSKDSLNNLIGSPLGYIGCQDGELGKKIDKSRAGIILFDEIEKADSNVINFFLELLEDGRYTDTLAREYDLNGYILIFSSNIKSQSDFLSMMPREFQSRLNEICHFTQISYKDRIAYINKAIEQIINEIAASISTYKVDDKKRAEIAASALKVGNNLREVRQHIFDHLVALT